MKPIKVLIVDDHEMVRTGLRQRLATENDIAVVGEAGDGVEGLNLAKRLCPDVAVFDVAMPKRGGLEAIALLKQTTPQVKRGDAVHVRQRYLRTRNHTGRC